MMPPSRQLRVGNAQREYSALAKEDPLAVYLLVNGTLEMGAGKTASQAFQMAMWMLADSRINEDESRALAQWREEGARTIVRVAETESIWQRLLEEIDGFLLCDEGLTEVASGEATVLCTWPLRRSLAPKLLAHKRLPLLG